nr:hypothetical protein [uncultured Oscillibacter sp.]
MSLSIVAAKDIDQALEILSAKAGKAMKSFIAEEPEGADRFLYDFQDAFTNYAIYYRFDPYRDIQLEAGLVPAIRAFSDSIGTWLEEHETEENRVIQKYGLSFQKIRRFTAELSRVCDVAIEHGYGLAGIGD